MKLKAGQLIEANLDLVLGNDVTAPVAIGEMKKMNVDCVFCKDKIALVPDHLHQIKTSSQQNFTSVLKILQKKIRLLIILKQEG